MSTERAFTPLTCRYVIRNNHPNSMLKEIKVHVLQAVCDANMGFLDAVCKWPGSCHDSFIMRQSKIYEQFENSTNQNAVLLGDSGYPLKSWLMTPIADPRTPAEEKYNQAHKQTRSIIEK